jgi:short-subunit dehydrogenase
MGWAVVTGASSGIGRSLALALVDSGRPVLAVARRGDRLQVLADEVAARGGRLEPLAADLSTSAGVETVLSSPQSRDVELLINNAGAAAYGPFAGLAPERFHELVRVNVDAVLALTHGLLPSMLERRRGGVINIASEMAYQAMPYFAVYAATKAFVLSFSEALAEELRGSGVRVTAIAPGFTTTEFASVGGSEAAERRLPHLDPEQVAAIALRAHARGRTVKVVGRTYSVLAFSGRLAPRMAVRWMMGRMFRPAVEEDAR